MIDLGLPRPRFCFFFFFLGIIGTLGRLSPVTNLP
jgi:hypothetical protein